MIREAKEADLFKIIDIAIRSRQKIYAQLMPPSVWSNKPYDDWYKGYRDIIEGNSKIENQYFCVVENDQKIVGFGIAGYVYPESRHNLPLHWIHEIFLDPDQIGKKYGTALMSAMAKEMKKDDAKIIGLCVGQDNLRAQKFYENTGAKILRPFEDNEVHGFTVPAYIYQWDNIDQLIKD